MAHKLEVMSATGSLGHLSLRLSRCDRQLSDSSQRPVPEQGCGAVRAASRVVLKLYRLASIEFSTVAELGIQAAGEQWTD